MLTNQKILELKQQQTAYQSRLTRNLFRSGIKWTEKYIETAYGDIYPDWQSRKQIRSDEIKRTDIIGNPEKVEKFLSTALYGLEGDTDNAELLNELKIDFYKWIDAVGIDPRTCPERLKHFLVGFHEILEGNGEKINKDAINRTFEIDPSSQEYADNFANNFIGVQINLQNERKVEESLDGKDWRQLKNENNFEGNAEQGKRIFEQIVINHNYQNFYFWPQKNQQLSGYLTENGDAVINGDDYELVQGEIQATQEQVDVANQKQQELVQNRSNDNVWMKVGVGGGFIALITAVGIKVFKPAFR